MIGVKETVSSKRPNVHLRLLLISLGLKFTLISIGMYLSYGMYLSAPKIRGDTYLLSTNTSPSKGANAKVFITHETKSLKAPISLPFSYLFALADVEHANGVLDDRFYKSPHFSLWKKIVALVVWDADRFLRYATDDLTYATEDSSAFFPLLPYGANLFGRFLLFLHKWLISFGYFTRGGVMPKIMYTAIGGLLFANLSNVLSVLSLYNLLLEILKRRQSLKGIGDEAHQTGMIETEPRGDIKVEKLAYLGALFYIIYPGAVHSISIYTEGIFSLATFTGLLLLFWAEDCRIAAKMSKSTSRNIVMTYVYEFGAVCSFFIGCFSRSNGTLLLAPLFFYTIRTCDVFSRFNLLWLDYAKRIEPNAKVEDYPAMHLVCLRFLVHWLKALIQAIILMIPAVAFQMYFYVMYCIRLTPDTFISISKYIEFFKLFLSQSGRSKLMEILKNDKQYTRSWCTAVPPSIYKYVQWKYWDVEFLYVLRDPMRLHIFSYACTTYAVGILCLVRFYKLYTAMFKKLQAQCNTTVCPDSFISNLTWVKPLVSIVSHAEFGLMIHLFITVVTFLFYAHTDIILRQVCPLPCYFLHFAIIVERLSDVKGIKIWEYDFERFYAVIILGYCVITMSIGLPLFTNFIGFT
ncbi:GPI mannosyltransferase 2 [Babesia duncani]|uniref:GPI mannosyltransferase 2 n=1 Tax=Babesia duncani TaxID=323732 RepID=A0AAD9UMK4_9APIC|nr:GPI mannosyltransferase 2 [Babesia duncani]